jgi:membrane protein implicated in regulation of membrane protease activity
MIPIYWLILCIILLVIELLTMGLTTIWFAGGGIVAFFISLFGVSLEVQLTAFAVVSLLLLLFTRPVAMRFMKGKRENTNTDALIGAVATVVEPIDNLKEMGAVFIEGKVWTARAVTNELFFEKDETVTVLEVRGVKLIVAKQIV